MAQILSLNRTETSVVRGVPKPIYLGALITEAEQHYAVPAQGWSCPSAQGFDRGMPLAPLAPRRSSQPRFLGGFHSGVACQLPGWSAACRKLYWFSCGWCVDHLFHLLHLTNSLFYISLITVKIKASKLKIIHSHLKVQQRTHLDTHRRG